MAEETPAEARLRVGSVSFLNARPLVDGLDDDSRIDLREAVPSRLLDALVADEVDLALCPTIDFQTSPVPLQIVPVGGIGCDGPTLTVRLFSKVPVERVRRVHSDPNSHSSDALMRALLARVTGRRPDVHVLDPDDPAEPEAMLLIGDRVARAAPGGDRYPHQLDLGEAWRSQTGLPFVFAVWMARADRPLGELPTVLADQRRRNRTRLDAIARREAPARGWDVETARDYLGRLLRYAIGPRELEAMALFWAWARDAGVIDGARPMRIWPESDLQTN